MSGAGPHCEPLEPEDRLDGTAAGDAGSVAPGRRSGRGTPGWTRGRVVALTMLGAAVVLAASLPPWVNARVADAAGTTTLTASGSRSSSTVMPVALAAAAGAFALTLVDGWMRRVVALVVSACGVGILLGCAAVLVDPAAALRAPGVVPVSATTTLAPWFAVLAALVVVLGGLLALIRGEAWPLRPARRTGEAAWGTGGAAASRGPARSDWDALSEGDDPT
ncbi:Trp biosynthesis-associated membrane protein [Mobilicoccus sp.]|uniref:Trp biosynthesis-associated membrane protein n=2 Tax=Mobilicoccus sp. TaxID=2034349 RepID=UPI0028A8AD20|nr:Trp biosynthesis-associated membrane protein [Mobilicoccus sp.]